MVSGDAVNVAARLQQRGRAGTRCSSGSARRPRRAASSPTGRAERSTRRARASPSAPGLALTAPAGAGAARTAGLTAPLVGRDEELAILDRRRLARRARARAAARDAVRPGGRRQVAPARRAASSRLPDARVMQGRCLPYGEGITYWSLGRGGEDAGGDPRHRLRRAPRSRSSGPRSQSVVAEAHARARRRGDRLDDRLSAPGSPIVTADPDYVRRALTDAWQRYIGALGRRAAHRARRRGRPLGLGGAARPAGASRRDARRTRRCCSSAPPGPSSSSHRPTWGAGKQNATALSARAALAGGVARDSSRRCSARPRCPRTCATAILASAEGNPFFLEEMLQMLIEEGALERQNGGWAVDRPALRRPDSRLGSRRHRGAASTCSSERAQCACAAAPSSAASSGRAGRRRRRRRRSPRSAQRARLATASIPSMAGLREFAFKHALTRDVAYASLPRPERRDLHRQVAEWIQDVAPDRGGRDRRARRLPLRRRRSRTAKTIRASPGARSSCSTPAACSCYGEVRLRLRKAAWRMRWSSPRTRIERSSRSRWRVWT